ncbi:hypothetical protein PsorP6_001425 [Peronosclerospora sorghi]|uniref:Uncharacterized protein n=1 Tax=Peronosclerospora sorghi TaxID=230839 RepID=A0ACC0WXP8_9STRA|nr:hypothetical protein PsorP6_001425 [Peronosclerospora sorghi]
MPTSSHLAEGRMGSSSLNALAGACPSATGGSSYGSRCWPETPSTAATAAIAALAVAHLGLAVAYTAVGIEHLVHIAFLLAILLVFLRIPLLRINSDLLASIVSDALRLRLGEKGAPETLGTLHCLRAVRVARRLLVPSEAGKVGVEGTRRPFQNAVRALAVLFRRDVLPAGRQRRLNILAQSSINSSSSSSRSPGRVIQKAEEGLETALDEPQGAKIRCPSATEQILIRWLHLLDESQLSRLLERRRNQQVSVLKADGSHPKFGVLSDSAFPVTGAMEGRIVTPVKAVNKPRHRVDKTAAEWGIGAVDRCFRRLQNKFTIIHTSGANAFTTSTDYTTS